MYTKLELIKLIHILINKLIGVSEVFIFYNWITILMLKWYLFNLKTIFKIEYSLEKKFCANE